MKCHADFASRNNAIEMMIAFAKMEYSRYDARFLNLSFAASKKACGPGFVIFDLIALDAIVLRIEE